MQAAPTTDLPPNRQRIAYLVQYFVHLVILFLCAPSLVPGVNESHYLPKAKHAWDASYASGGDLFLESHDSHVLATAFAGLAARGLPLEAVAWLGRLTSWLLLAYAWGRWCQSLGIRPLLQPILLIAWFLATQYGHWAGEWAIGGFEAKSIAYPLALLGLAAVNNGRWPWAWLWLAAAVAWHPVVGGWIGLTVGLVWLAQLVRAPAGDRKRWLLQSLPWQVAAIAIGLVGVIPAAAGIGFVPTAVENRVAAANPDAEAAVDARNIVPSQVHVYFRLAHHMSPQTFAAERHSWAIASLLMSSAMTAIWLWLPNKRMKAVRDDQATSSTKNDLPPAGWILAVAWLAVAISCVGLAIDLGLSPRRPALASSLLRFYWFRWSDIAVPLAWTTTAIVSLQAFAFPSPNVRHATPQGSLALVTLLVAVGLLFGQHINDNLQRDYPPADEILMTVQGPNSIDTDRHRDWLAACQWIAENTPRDSLWFTPKYQQTFKWYAGRAEVICWKDVPQDNRSVVEWYRRVTRCQPPRGNASIRDWTTEELLQLSKEYGFKWVLLDRTYQLQPPALEYLYPIDIENRSFAIFRVP